MDDNGGAKIEFERRDDGAVTMTFEQTSGRYDGNEFAVRLGRDEWAEFVRGVLRFDLGSGVD